VLARAAAAHGAASPKARRRLSLDAAAALLLAAHQLLLPRLQRLCEHVLGRRLSARSLPRAVHLCSLLDGEPSRGPEDDDEDDDEDDAAAPLSDLHWFVQSFVRRHPRLVRLPGAPARPADAPVAAAAACEPGVVGAPA
jgi:hypothetical protein